MKRTGIRQCATVLAWTTIQTASLLQQALFSLQQSILYTMAVAAALSLLVGRITGVTADPGLHLTLLYIAKTIIEHFTDKIITAQLLLKQEAYHIKAHAQNNAGG